MTYDPTWSQGDATGLQGGVHSVRATDVGEIAAAINRRRELTYQDAQDYSGGIQAGRWIDTSVIDAATAPPFENLRSSWTSDILSAPVGTLGGNPPSPTCMDWLWPVADADEGKVIVASAPGAGEVGLFAKINGGSDWTDPTLAAGQTAVRTVHVNELRDAAAIVSRGRWTLPVYLAGGIFSIMPDTPWIGDSVANNGSDELRAVGFAWLRSPATPSQGLVNVTVRDASELELTASDDCSLAIYRCCRAIDFLADPPTWNEYAPLGSSAWALPGGTGAGDAVYLGQVSLAAGVPGTLSNSALALGLQAMVDGEPQNFLIRRTDASPDTIDVSATARIEFDLNTPPN